MEKVLYSCYWEITNEDWTETFDQQEIKIDFTEFPVIKETHKTYILKLDPNQHKGKSKAVVLKNQSGKRFAYETKERALDAFIIKRCSYGRRLKQSIKNNDRLIDIAKSTNVTTTLQ